MTRQSKDALQRSLHDRDGALAETPVDLVKLAEMEDAVWRLSTWQRRIFLAVRIDDLSFAEIADRTGLSVGQVERLLGKAIRNLSRNLDDPRRYWWRRSRWWRWFR